MTRATRRTTIIALGSPLMGDDGLGLQAVARLVAHYELPSDVVVVDGGTWGMSLLPDIEDADRLLMVDAIKANREPGAEVLLDRAELPRHLALKSSAHEVSLSEVIALADLRGTLPQETWAIGLEPEVVALGTALSPRISTALDALVERIRGMLEAWGHSLVPRAEPDPRAAAVFHHA